MEEGLDLVATTYRGRPIAVRTQLLLEEIVSGLGQDDEPPHP